MVLPGGSHLVIEKFHERQSDRFVSQRNGFIYIKHLAQSAGHQKVRGLNTILKLLPLIGSSALKI